jgi:antitoxin component YwqK of YwqJK toxin-antitoxin module
MKHLFFILFTFCLGLSFAQIAKVPAKKKCYEDSLKQKIKKYAEWQCGRDPRIVDCNEKLVFEEGSKTFYSGQSTIPFTGTCETCHNNGLIERKVNFKEGKENGVDTTYYASGCLQVIRSQIMGVEDGVWQYFYDSTGYTAWEMSFKNGNKEGIHIYYNKRGDTTKFETYKNNILNGIKKTYYSNGKVEKIVTYKNGKFDGSFQVFNLEGKIIQDTKYKDGKKNGAFTYYYNDGVVLSTESWVNDLRNGEFKTFFHDGKIQKTEHYVNGKKDGWYEERWSSDKLKHKIFYKNDVIVKEFRYDELGVVTYTFGDDGNADEVDDAIPTQEQIDKKKKARAKKAKKDKKKKEGLQDQKGVINVK